MDFQNDEQRAQFNNAVNNYMTARNAVLDAEKQYKEALVLFNSTCVALEMSNETRMRVKDFLDAGMLVAA